LLNQRFAPPVDQVQVFQTDVRMKPALSLIWAIETSK
jgi:hypothetical protein